MGAGFPGGSVIGFDGQSVALLAALLCLAAAGWALARERDLLFPPVILGLAWGTTLLFYALRGRYLPSLHVTTGAMLASGPWLFALAAQTGVGARWPVSAGGPGPAASRHVGDAIIVVAGIGLPFLILRAVAVGEAGPTGNILVNLRIAMVESGEDPLGRLAYLSNFAVFGAGLHALGLVVTTRWRVALMTVLALVYCAVTTGRTHFTMLLALLGGGLAISGRIRTRTFAGGFLAAFATVFLAMGLLLGKISNDGSTLEDAWNHLSVYLLGGVAALDDFLRLTDAWAWGENVGRTVIAVLNRLGMAAEPVALVKEFRVVGVETNVYTVYRPYFEDFGWAGVVLAQLLMGYASGLAYARARAGSRPATFVYGLLLYPTVMQVFEDQYFSLLSTWLQAAALLAVILALARLGPRSHPAHRAQAMVVDRGP